MTTTPPGASSSDAPERAAKASDLVRIVTSVAAPTTVATALLLFFGFNRTAHLFLSFGVDVRSLGLTTEDYLLRSVEAVYGPVVLGLVVAALALAAHRRIGRFAADPARTRTLQRLTMGLLVGGGLLLARGMLGIFVPAVSRDELVLSPFALTAGVVLLAYGSRLRARRDPDATPLSATNQYLGLGISLAIGLLGLLWATTNYAQAYGRATAEELATGSIRRPAVTVHSDRPLSLDHPDVAVREGSSSDRYPYRYEGLHLLTEADGRLYLFVVDPAASGVTTFVVPVDEHVRMDLHGS